MTGEPITSGQGRQYKRFVEDAAERALEEVRLDKDGIQRLIGHGGDFQADIVASVRKHSSHLVGEEVTPRFGYPPGYRVKSITDQVKILRQLFSFPAVAEEEIASRELPEGAEGWFVIPHWIYLAKTYNEAVELVLCKIAESRPFSNDEGGALGPQFLRRPDRTIWAMDLIAHQQMGHILVVPAQFGLRHRGRSIRLARKEFAANEFGLGAFAVGCMLLTHPERLVSESDLGIECAGDDYATQADDHFDSSLCFDFAVGKMGFGTARLVDASEPFGSASAFLLQQLPPTGG